MLKANKFRIFLPLRLVSRENTLLRHSVHHIPYSMAELNVTLLPRHQSRDEETKQIFHLRDLLSNPQPIAS